MTPAIINTVAIVLTLMVLSRIAGDNPLFRIAQYLFVGVSLGLAFVVAYHQVLVPAVRGLGNGQSQATIYGIPLGADALGSIQDLGLPVLDESFYAMVPGKGNELALGQWLNLGGTTPAYPY